MSHMHQIHNTEKHKFFGYILIFIVNLKNILIHIMRKSRLAFPQVTKTKKREENGTKFVRKVWFKECNMYKKREREREKCMKKQQKPRFYRELVRLD